MQNCDNACDGKNFPGSYDPNFACYECRWVMVFMSKVYSYEICDFMCATLWGMTGDYGWLCNQYCSICEQVVQLEI